ncbi:MAG: hypothetical protein VX290_04250, partial [Candidatus Latescibacterota bacterium]|nr:hypothetical protein [Candidatus Latescibacterota bacterium]
DSYLSICGTQDGAKIDCPHMLKTVAWPTPVRSSDDQLWLLEAYLLPVQPQIEYGIYVLGPDQEQQQSFADITCVFFPY